jgi:magnesium chelatase family protein
LNKKGLAMIRIALERYADHRILKLGRTIADLAGSEQMHLAEALQYRPLQLL